MAVELSIAGQTAPAGPAGGVLDGEYPDPDFAADMATQAELDASLAAKQDAFLITKQAADVTHNVASFVNTDLIFPFVVGGVYVVDLFLLCTSSLAATGYRFAIDTSVAVTTVGLIFAHVLANVGTMTGGQSRADDTATGVTSAVDAANQIVPIMGSGILVAGANAGTARLRFGPENAVSATFKANSVMRALRIA